MHLKRFFALLLVLLCALIFGACGSSATTPKAKINPPPERIPATAIATVCEAEPIPLSAKPCIPQSAVRPDGYSPQAPPKTFTLTGSQIHLSHRGAQLIEGFEGWASCPYWDSYGGVWTRGYGETEGIHSYSSCISRSFGERNLTYRAERFYGYAIVRLRTSFNQNEIDAQFSFLWNLGAGIDPPGSSLANGFQHHSCAGILAYVHAGGVTLAGLVTRRRAECRRFNEPAHEETPAQHRARVKRERTAKLHADYRKRRGLRLIIARYRCSGGYRGFSHDHKRKCTVWRSGGAAVNRDIARLHRLGIR